MQETTNAVGTNWINSVNIKDSQSLSPLYQGTTPRTVSNQPAGFERTGRNRVWRQAGWLHGVVGFLFCLLRNDAPGQGQPRWEAVGRDATSTEWRQIEWVTNDTGQAEPLMHRYIELGNSLNYVDGAGEWRPSEDAIELMAKGVGGAAALRGPTKVFFPPTLGGKGDAITLITPGSNTVLRIRPLALYLSDGTQTALVGSVAEADGELVPPNQVVYHSVFGSNMIPSAATNGTAATRWSITRSLAAMACPAIFA
jgi:hypothetical protein